MFNIHKNIAYLATVYLNINDNVNKGKSCVYECQCKYTYMSVHVCVCVHSIKVFSSQSGSKPSSCVAAAVRTPVPK